MTGINPVGYVNLLPYYLTYGILLLSAVLGQNLFSQYFGHYDRQVRTLLYWILLLGLFVFAGFRYEVGCDWSNYEKIFNGNTFTGLGLAPALLMNELGYVGLINILNQYGMPYQYFNVVLSFLFFLGLHSLARRQPNPVTVLALAYPVLILNLALSGVRQGAAVGLICFAINSFIDKRLVKYILFVLMAASFHSSAISFLLLTPFVHGDFSKKNILRGSFLIIPAFLFLSSTAAYQLAMLRYVETNISAFGGIYRVLLLGITGLLFVIYLAPKWRKLYPHDYKIVSIGAWGMLLCMGLQLVSSVIGDRLGYYLIPFQLIIFARLQFIPGKYRQLLYLAPFIALTTMFVAWTQMSYFFNLCYIPYQIRF